MKIRKHSAFTLIELLVVISIIAIIAGFALPVFANAQKKGRLANSVNNAKQIGTAMKMYAGDNDGIFPKNKGDADSNNLVANSNEAMEQLMPKYTKSKAIFIERGSAWCSNSSSASESSANQNKLQPGQCDWAYVRGLTDTSDTRWPLFATAFSEGGSYTYVSGKAKKGGVWEATDAVVVYVDTSVKQVNDKNGLKSDDDFKTSFVSRPDKKTSNAFVKEGDWLDGDDLQVLQPQ